jgi:hypothetical protein
VPSRNAGEGPGFGPDRRASAPPHQVDEQPDGEHTRDHIEAHGNPMATPVDRAVRPVAGPAAPVLRYARCHTLCLAGDQQLFASVYHQDACGGTISRDVSIGLARGVAFVVELNP